MDNPLEGRRHDANDAEKLSWQNLLAVIALAFLLQYAHGGDCMRSAKIGAVAGFGIAGGGHEFEL